MTLGLGPQQPPVRPPRKGASAGNVLFGCFPQEICSAANCGYRSEATVVNYAGPGRGEFVQETRFQFVGAGGGEFVPKRPTGETGGCCGLDLRLCGGAALALATVVLLVFLALPLATATTTTINFAIPPSGTVKP
eukprot:CAMPEP_0168693900 /NCGR_PEP_ID=MMETSP0503-20121227/34013_1 /TAXON_ID=89963 /ORGANISM="Heterocapsa rotundata, Strain SCCAP K-0483" /LENGTH=134 /DNA_ID=CAMNT_0008739521 /DNA_START=106 /DNA_END=506 /DNA_ORIENTATION=+